MAKKAFGTTLQRSGTLVGEITNAAVPEIIQGSVETTSHSTSGSGWKTFMPSGLKELSEFSLTLVAGSTLFNTLYGDMTAESVLVYTVKYSGSGLGDWTFSAFPTSIKISDMDAQSPGMIEMVVKFQTSGSLVA